MASLRKESVILTGISLFCNGVLCDSFEDMGLFVQVSLVSQIWPSGQEPGSQLQSAGSIPPSHTWDPTLVLPGGVASGGFSVLTKE